MKLSILLFLTILFSCNTSSLMSNRSGCLDGSTERRFKEKYSSILNAKSKSKWIKNDNDILVFNPYPKKHESILYVGGSKNSYADGFGKLTWLLKGKKDSSYEGHFLKGKHHGKGKIINSNNDELSGTFIYGFLEGKGKIRYKNGNILKGKFKKGKINGYAEINCPNGDKFQGTFKDNLRNGKGTYFWRNGEKLDGEYVYGKLNGHATYYKEGLKDISLEFENGKLLNSEYQLLQDQITSTNQPPKIKKYGRVQYPCIPLKAHIEGLVVIEFEINETGIPTDFSIVESTNKMFNVSALIAAHQYTFEPAKTIEGRPIAVRWRIPFRYRIRN